MNPMVEAWQAEFLEMGELARFAPGEQVKARARVRIDEILDQYNAWKCSLFVDLVEVDLAQITDHPSSGIL
jgi:hypothetical protein